MHQTCEVKQLKTQTPRIQKTVVIPLPSGGFFMLRRLSWGFSIFKGCWDDKTIKAIVPETATPCMGIKTCGQSGACYTGGQ